MTLLNYVWADLHFSAGNVHILAYFESYIEYNTEWMCGLNKDHKASKSKRIISVFYLRWRITTRPLFLRFLYLDISIYSDSCVTKTVWTCQFLVNPIMLLFIYRWGSCYLISLTHSVMTTLLHIMRLWTRKE